VFSPGRVGGENWQSSSFSGGVVHRKEGVAQRVADLDGWMLGRSIDLDRVSLIEEEYAR